MSLHVLSDGDVRALLAGLDAAQLDSLFNTLGSALQTYSTGNEKQYQCHRQGVTRPGQTTMLFMPATLPDGCSVKVVGVPPPNDPQAAAAPAAADPGKPPKGLTGVVLVCDEDGRAVGVLNAAALTAFRTALGSILLYRFRAATRHVVVFGAGKQALWHVRLALLLRRADIATVTVVNRSAARAHDMIAACQQAPTHSRGAAADWDTSHIAFRFVEAATEEIVRQADVLFCTTPSKVPLFPAAWLTSTAARQQKTRFVSAIGSYKLDMQELDPALLRAVATDYPGSYRLDTAAAGSTLLVDSRDACAVEAGELVLAQIPDEQLMETGELVDFRSRPDTDAAEKQRLDAWLRDGNVVYKSVGIGIMDLSIGRALLQLGASLGVGTTIAQF